MRNVFIAVCLIFMCFSVQCGPLPFKNGPRVVTRCNTYTPNQADGGAQKSSDARTRAALSRNSFLKAYENSVINSGDENEAFRCKAFREYRCPIFSDDPWREVGSGVEMVGCYDVRDVREKGPRPAMQEAIDDGLPVVSRMFNKKLAAEAKRVACLPEKQRRAHLDVFHRRFLQKIYAFRDRLSSMSTKELENYFSDLYLVEQGKKPSENINEPSADSASDKNSAGYAPFSLVRQFFRWCSTRVFGQAQ